MAAQATVVGRVVLLLLGGATAAFVGYRALLSDAPQGVPPVATAPTPAQEPAAPAPEPVAVAEPAPTPLPEPAPEPVPAPPAPPNFDVVRIEPDGEALIAGTAPADAQVSLLLDGVQETKVQADRQGKFVALFTLAPNPAPRVLGLEATLPDGSTLAGTATVAIAPIAAVVPVAPATAPATAPEPAPPAALLITEDGAEVVAAVPEVPAGEVVPVMLDAISYSPDGAVQLAGRGQGGAMLRIYLDNAAIADVTVPDDGGWATTLPDTAPGLYTLRIDQLAADGSVTARTETPFKRETLQALAQAAGVAAPDVADVAPPEPVADAVAEPPAAPPAEPETVTIAEPAPVVAPEVATAEPAPEPAPVDEPPVAAVAAPVSEPEPVPQASVPASVAPVTITVQPGFTLWGIATDMMGEGTMYVQVFEANKDKIRNPDLIYPGQVFTLPQE